MTDITSHEIIPPNLEPKDLEEFLTSRTSLELENIFTQLKDKAIAAQTNPGSVPDPTAYECRAGVLASRILRRTNTGPAKAKKASSRQTKAEKAAEQAAALNKLLGLE